MRRSIFILSLIFTICGRLYSQDIKQYSFEIGQFDKVRVLDDVNVVYRCVPDSTGFVQFSGAEEFADAFILTAKGDGKLKIQVSTEDVGKPGLPTLYIYSDFLSSVENSSNFLLKVESVAPCAEFKATQIGNGRVAVDDIVATKVSATINTGNGSVNISGKCENAVLKMVGSGMIAADRLKAQNVQCKILGTGSIGCWATENLSVRGIGSTKIYYKGSPKVKKSGGGKLFELPESMDYENSVVLNEENDLEEHLQQYEEEENSEDEELNENEDEEPQTVVTLEDD